MKKYQSYKDSGVEWIGEIPNHWKVGNLSKAIDEKRKLTYGIVQAGEKLKYGVAYIRPVDMDSNGIPSVSVLPKTSPEIASNYKRSEVLEGDVIMSIGPSYGKLGIARREHNGSNLTQGTARIAISEDNFNKYFFYILSSPRIKEYWSSVVTGATFSALNLQPLGSTKVVFPPLSEQQQIVSFLDRKTQQIDDLIQHKEKKIELLKEKRLKLVEKAIVNSEMKRMRLDYAVDVIQRPINRVDAEAYTKIGMYNWGRGLFLYEEQMGLDLGDSTFYYLEKEDLIISGQFAWEGAVSLVSENEEGCIASHRFHVIRGKKDVLLTDYLWAYFTSQEGHFLLDDNSTGSAGRNRPLNIGKLLKEKIPVPDMKYQEEIQNLVKTERQYEVYGKKSIQLLKEYRQSLISDVVTGKIRVCEEDLSVQPNLQSV